MHENIVVCLCVSECVSQRARQLLVAHTSENFATYILRIHWRSVLTRLMHDQFHSFGRNRMDDLEIRMRY